MEAASLGASLAALHLQQPSPSMEAASVGASLVALDLQQPSSPRIPMEAASLDASLAAVDVQLAPVSGCLVTWATPPMICPEVQGELETTSMAAVLGDTDLLCEILVRLSYPSCLVRAASVSKFWLSNASDPQLLKRFLKINPTQILGYYLVAEDLLHPRFVTTARAALDSDISTMLTLASSQFDVWEDIPVTIWDCRNGKILIEIGGKLEVRDYLTKPCSIAAYPQSPLKLILNQSFKYQHHEFLPSKGKGHEYYRLAIGHRDDSIIVCLSLLCGHIWVNRTSSVMALPEFATCSEFLVPFGKLGKRKLYLVTTCDLVIVLHIETMKMVFVRIPKDLVEDCYDFDLCPGHAEVEMFLIGLSQSSLSVWSYEESGTNEYTWHLMHCISVQVVFRGVDELSLSLWGVGEHMEFVLFKVDNSIYRLDMGTTKLIKEFELDLEDGELERIFPCLMIWPPTFPSSTRSYEPAQTISPEIFNKITDQSQGGQRHKPIRSRRRLLTEEPSQSAPNSALVLVSLSSETDTAGTISSFVLSCDPQQQQLHQSQTPPCSDAEATVTDIPELLQSQPHWTLHPPATAPVAASLIDCYHHSEISGETDQSTSEPDSSL